MTQLTLNPLVQTSGFLYLDTETCGLHGVPVLLQYAEGRLGEIKLWEFWHESVRDSMELIEWICGFTVVGFNLAFDWFHLQKFYTMLDLFVKKGGDENEKPIDHIETFARLEKEARDGPCIKPVSALDLMLHFRKTELQVTMERDDIRIRRVPRVLAEDLARLLTDKIQLDPILFAGYKKHAPRFQVKDLELDDGTIHPSLCNIILRFRPNGSLKGLASHLLGVETTSFQEIEIDRKLRPKEYGFAPFAESRGKPGNWQWTWPQVVKFHIDHWRYNQRARTYAANDVNFTRGLHEYANWVEGGDEDSVLACCVASCRWKGYKVNIEGLHKVANAYRKRLKAPIAPSRVRAWINEVLNPIEEAIAWRNGTSKKALKTLAKEWKEGNPEAAKRAQAVLDARAAKKKLEVIEKLIIAGRFHASFKVIGALSGRMSGADKLNPQGIDKTKEVRGQFPLAFELFLLLGGDMKSFEISIAAADYGDPKLEELLTTCDTHNERVVLEDGVLRCQSCIEQYSSPDYSRRCPKCGLGLVVNEKDETRCNRCYGAECKSFHGLFGAGFFPELGYEGIMATKGLTVGNLYNPCKNGAFATLYGAQPVKLADTIGVDEDVAVEGYHKFWRTFSEAGKKRRAVELDFTSLVSERIGSRIEYREPKDAIESLLGYKRYFTLENYLIKEIYNLACNIPKAWTKIREKIIRGKKGEQTVSGAIASALYGCAFALQNAIIRQAANHRIQATGAGITKRVQVAVWNLQPAGVHKWMVQPMNVHDEIQCPTDPEIRDEVFEVVRTTVESFRPIIPLIGIDFGQLTLWSDK